MPKAHISKSLRSLVASRAEHLCEYCTAPKAYAPSPFTIDHVKPLSLGGATEAENLAYACEICNGSKSDKTDAIDPDTGLETPLFNPRTDLWKDHFTWNQDDLEILGITTTGRVTVLTLQMNHQAVVNMRILLKMVGEHPPLSTI